MELPPGQQLVAADKWPSIGERHPAASTRPWTVSVVGCVRRPLVLSLDDLRSLPRTGATVDIHCVTRWSKLGVPFAGVLLADVVARAEPTDEARFVSFVARSERNHSTSLPLSEALDLGTLVAWEAEGRPLEKVHGGPVRTVVPGRYFYKSLKWLERIELLPDDRLGFWEADAGYHNAADPWREQRYMAADLSKTEVRRLLEARDFSGRDLRSLSAADRDLAEPPLDAREALLRDADFRRSKLNAACFDRANLSNAHFEAADLRGASFRDADCEGANFAGADLRGADFTGASLFGATFRGERDGRPTGAPPARLDDSTQLPAEASQQLTPVQADFIREIRPGG